VRFGHRGAAGRRCGSGHRGDRGFQRRPNWRPPPGRRAAADVVLSLRQPLALLNQRACPSGPVVVCLHRSDPENRARPWTRRSAGRGGPRAGWRASLCTLGRRSRNVPAGRRRAARIAATGGPARSAADRRRHPARRTAGSLARPGPGPVSRSTGAAHHDRPEGRPRLVKQRQRLLLSDSTTSAAAVARAGGPPVRAALKPRSPRWRNLTAAQRAPRWPDRTPAQRGHLDTRAGQRAVAGGRPPSAAVSLPECISPWTSAPSAAAAACRPGQPRCAECGSPEKKPS